MTSRAFGRRTVLVTGASGFVGVNLARRLAAEGEEVHCVVRPGHHRWRLTGMLSEVHLHEIDLSDHASVAALASTLAPYWVFHCAAYGAYPEQDDFWCAFSTNVVDTLSLIQCCTRAGARAIVHAGSSSEYGVKDHAPDESEALAPNSAYAATKAAATLLLRYLTEHGDAPVTVLRLYSVYGPWERPTRLVPTVLSAAAHGRWPPLAEAETARDFVYVDDVVEAMLAVARQGRPSHHGSVFNVGTGRQTTLSDLIEVVKRMFTVDAEPAWSEANRRPWDCTTWVADSKRIASEVGWAPRTDLADGLMAMYEWMQSSPRIRRMYGLQM